MVLHLFLCIYPSGNIYDIKSAIIGDVNRWHDKHTITFICMLAPFPNIRYCHSS